MKPWHFVYIADLQPGSPRSYRFKPALLENWHTARDQIVEIQPELMVIGGDIARDGNLHQWELEEMKADIDSMGIPYHTIPGNMDVGNKRTDVPSGQPGRRDVELNITSQWLHQFEEVFGPTTWSFVHKNVRFSGFCDILLGSGLPEEQPLVEWLEGMKKPPEADHHIWLMHYPLFVDSPDEKTWDITNPEEYTSWYFTVNQSYRDFLFDVFQKSRADRVITGHIHCRKDHAARGIQFDLSPSPAFSQWDDHWPDGDPTLGFFRFDVEGTELRKTFIPLEKVSTRTDGYGKGGHPPPEERDYSLAWVK